MEVWCLLVVYCSLLFFATTMAQTSLLYMDDQLAEQFRDLIQKTYAFEANNSTMKVLLPRPFVSLASSTYNPSSSRTAPKEWSLLVDTYPVFENTTDYLYFSPGVQTTSFYWNNFVQQYEWNDVTWAKDYCITQCSINLSKSQSQITAMELQINNTILAQSRCTDAVCSDVNQKLLEVYNATLSSLNTKFTEEKAKVVELSDSNFAMKVTENQKLFNSAKLTDSGMSYYASNFFPTKFAEILFETNPNNYDNYDISNWETLQTFQLSNIYACNITAGDNSSTAAAYDILMDAVDTKGLSQLILLSLSPYSDISCAAVNVTIYGGMVEVERYWLSRMLWKMSDYVAVSNTARYEWSDGNFDGLFPATIDQFFAAKTFTIHFDGGAYEGGPHVLSWFVEVNPAFPPQLGASIVDALIANGTILNSTEIVRNSSNSIYTSLFDPTTCCIGLDKPPVCKIPAFIQDYETIPAMDAVLTSSNATAYDLRFTFEQELAKKEEYYFAFVALLIILAMFSIFWPLLSGGILSIGILNQVLITKKKRNELLKRERFVAIQPLTMAAISKAIQQKNS